MEPVTATLLSRAAAGDQEAWDALVDRYVRLMWSVARSYRLRHEDAADAIQTTWLRLLERLDQIDQPNKLGAWLATTVRNECLRVLRSGGRERLYADDSAFDHADSGPSVETRIVLAERDAALWLSFQRLSAQCQLLLRLLSGSPAPTYDEVSAAMSIPIGSIGPTRGRCLAKLRQLMGDRDEYHGGG